MPATFALLDFGAPELLIIFLIVLLLFGGKKLPQLARSVGQSAGELKKGLNEGASDKEQTAAKSEHTA